LANGGEACLAAGRNLPPLLWQECAYDVIPNPVARSWRMVVRDLLFAFCFLLFVFALGEMSNRTYYVYILASRSRNLYTGVTNDLLRRMVEHRDRLVPGFTSQYRIFRLVHFEIFGDIRLAIAREKEIKSWRREKKLWLIERDNPTWEDLSEALEKGS
jgi:putative endonuclease